MSINRRVELEWNGKSCSVLVTMEVIERLEEKLNLAGMARDVSQGNVKFSQAARLVAMLLNMGGVEVTTQDVFDGMFDGEGESGTAVVAAVTQILNAVFPGPKKKSTTSKKRPKKPA